MDLANRKKAMVWIATAAALALVTVPSAMLLRTLRNYYRFLSGWDPGVLKPVEVRRVPHRGAAAGEAPRVRFVEFSLHAPRAKKVFLAGDFNHWKPETMPLSKARSGRWQILLPLPPGRYSYLFQVDGDWVLDPSARDTSVYGEMKTSMRHIQ